MNVSAAFKSSRTPFPDQSYEIITLRQSEDAIIVEFWLTGTHPGPLKAPAGDVASTGKTFRAQVCARSSNARGGPTRSPASGFISIKGDLEAVGRDLRRELPPSREVAKNEDGY